MLLAAQNNTQKAIPALAKNSVATQSIERAIKRVPTRRQLILGDSRHMDEIEDESVHLVVTSPPYWTLKQYPDQEGQLGRIEEYDKFLENLDQVWKNTF